MKEEIVTFETAKLAKEKGFNEDTNLYYREDGQIDGALYYDPVPNNKDISEEWFSGDDYEENKPALCTSPSQSLIQRWLRENHKINVFINYADTTPPNRQTFKYQLYRDKTAKEQIGNFNSYEEALEQGLQEALKLLH